MTFWTINSRSDDGGSEGRGGVRWRGRGGGGSAFRLDNIEMKLS